MGHCAIAQTLIRISGNEPSSTAPRPGGARIGPHDGQRLAGACRNEVTLHYCNLETIHTSAEACIDMLPDEDRSRARRFHRDADRLRFCIGRVMLRTLLAAYTGQTPQSITLSTGPNDKPVMNGGPSFNLSHSGTTVLVGVAESGDLGVDVEAVRAIDDIDSLARSCLSNREIEALAAWAAGEKLRAFLRAWTRKEAFVKALGTGIGIDLKSFSVSMNDTGDNALLDAGGCCPDADSWAVVPVRIPGAFEAAVAWNRPRFSVQVQEFESVTQVTE